MTAAAARCCVRRAQNFDETSAITAAPEVLFVY